MQVGEKRIRVGLLVASGALAVWLLYQRAQKAAYDAANPAPDAVQDPFTTPYYQGIPGSNSSVIMNGSDSPFYSTINVSLDANIAQSLANQYIPVFGFIGVTAVGSAPIAAQLPPTMVISPPPPPPAQFNSAPAINWSAAGYKGYTPLGR